MAVQFLVHAKADTVGIVVVEDVQPGGEITGWIMDTDEALTLPAIDAVPFGHKIALRSVNAGEAVIEYGHHIGQAVRDIARGSHVHVHNLETRRPTHA